MKPGILAVDNDQLALLSLKVLFEDDEVDVATVTSGPQAIALFRDDPSRYSVVILDFDMKINCVGMNGDEVARQLQAIRGDVRMIMISGKETAEVLKASPELR
jgi:CheY-like chemotaxis protein